MGSYSKGANLRASGYGPSQWHLFCQEILTLQVVWELKVGFGRRKQVVVAVIPERSEHFVVKFYDPTLNPPVDLRLMDERSSAISSNHRLP